MTDRDQFAAAALTGLLANEDLLADDDKVADTAYELADAMLRVRSSRIADKPAETRKPTGVADACATAAAASIGCDVLVYANHDAVPAATAPVDRLVRLGATDRESVGIDKAEPLNRDCGTGNTNARLAALEQLSALDQELELEYGLTGNPLIKAQEHMRSQNCCYCEKPHGKSFPLIFQSCDACQDARDKRAIDASNGLISVSCPRCDLQFSADATHSLTDEEREAIKWAAVVSEGLCQMGAMNRARTLLGMLERLG